jgi:hypothetical protein
MRWTHRSGARLIMEWVTSKHVAPIFDSAALPHASTLTNPPYLHEHGLRMLLQECPSNQSKACRITDRVSQRNRRLNVEKLWTIVHRGICNVADSMHDEVPQALLQCGEAEDAPAVPQDVGVQCFKGCGDVGVVCCLWSSSVVCNTSKQQMMRLVRCFCELAGTLLVQVLLAG